MDAVLRVLREGPSESGPAPLLLWQADAAAPAPLRLFVTAVTDLAAAAARSAAHGTGLTLLALQHPADTYVEACAALHAETFVIVDCFSDPYGWWQQDPEQLNDPQPPQQQQAVSLCNGLLARGGLLRLQQLLTATAGRCVVIDSLTPLLDAHGAAQVAATLKAVRLATAASAGGRASGPSCLLCGVNAEVHSRQELAALEGLAAGVVQLTGKAGLVMAAVPGELAARGLLSVRVKRRMGRVRTHADVYSVDGNGQVSLAPAAAAGGHSNAHAAPAPLASAAPPSKPSAPPPDLLDRLGNGMKLSVSESEAAARQAVQLPFEHGGTALAAGFGAGAGAVDFRDLLPREAGGAAPAGHSLGRILYVRDSDESDADSDDLLDDDLEV